MRGPDGTADKRLVNGADGNANPRQVGQGRRERRERFSVYA